MWRSRSWPGGGAATARKGEGRLGAEPVLKDKRGPASAGEAQPTHGPPEAGRCVVRARSYAVEAGATVALNFHPKGVCYRLSDFALGLNRGKVVP